MEDDHDISLVIITYIEDSFFFFAKEQMANLFLSSIP